MRLQQSETLKSRGYLQKSFQYQISCVSLSVSSLLNHSGGTVTIRSIESKKVATHLILVLSTSDCLSLVLALVELGNQFFAQK